MDYRELLLKYIAHVDDYEGANYIDRINDRSLSVKFTVEEAAEMKNLDDESRKYIPR